MGSQQVKHNTHKQYKANNTLYWEIFATVLFLLLLPSAGESKTGQIQMSHINSLKTQLSGRIQYMVKLFAKLHGAKITLYKVIQSHCKSKGTEYKRYQFCRFFFYLRCHPRESSS